MASKLASLESAIDLFIDAYRDSQHPFGSGHEVSSFSQYGRLVFDILGVYQHLDTLVPEVANLSAHDQCHLAARVQYRLGLTPGQALGVVDQVLSTMTEIADSIPDKIIAIAKALAEPPELDVPNPADDKEPKPVQPPEGQEPPAPGTHITSDPVPVPDSPIVPPTADPEPEATPEPASPPPAESPASPEPDAPVEPTSPEPAPTELPAPEPSQEGQEGAEEPTSAPEVPAPDAGPETAPEAPAAPEVPAPEETAPEAAAGDAAAPTEAVDTGLLPPVSGNDVQATGDSADAPIPTEPESAPSSEQPAEGLPLASDTSEAPAQEAPAPENGQESTGLGVIPEEAAVGSEGTDSAAPGLADLGEGVTSPTEIASEDDKQK